MNHYYFTLFLIYSKTSALFSLYTNNMLFIISCPATPNNHSEIYLIISVKLAHKPQDDSNVHRDTDSNRGTYKSTSI